LFCADGADIVLCRTLWCAHFFVILIRSLATSLGGGLSRRGGHLHEDGRRCGAPRTAHLPEAAAALSAQADAPDAPVVRLPGALCVVEWLWSELGKVLTKMRNRTAFEKAFRIVKVRSQLRC